MVFQTLVWGPCMVMEKWMLQVKLPPVFKRFQDKEMEWSFQSMESGRLRMTRLCCLFFSGRCHSLNPHHNDCCVRWDWNRSPDMTDGTQSTLHNLLLHQQATLLSPPGFVFVLLLLSVRVIGHCCTPISCGWVPNLQPNLVGRGF